MSSAENHVDRPIFVQSIAPSPAVRLSYPTVGITLSAMSGPNITCRACCGV
jgi:hypothetical protein